MAHQCNCHSATYSVSTFDQVKVAAAQFYREEKASYIREHPIPKQNPFLNYDHRLALLHHIDSQATDFESYFVANSFDGHVFHRIHALVQKRFIRTVERIAKLMNPEMRGKEVHSAKSTH
jgi:hypothetical protein